MRKLYIILLTILCVNLASCNKDVCKHNEEAFNIKKTEIHNTYKGGTGEIITNKKGLKASCSDNWVHPTCIKDTVKLVIDANKSKTSRTAILTISYNGEKQMLPITQLGIISIIEIEDHQFDYTGGSVTFPWDTEEEYEIGEMPEWLSYNIDNKAKEITFTAKQNDGDAKKAKVQIFVGELFNQVCSFSINAAPKIAKMEYAELAGEYTLTYKNIRMEEVTADVVLATPGDNVVTLTGLSYELLLKFDPSTYTLSINCQNTTLTADNKPVAINALSVKEFSEGNYSIIYNEEFGVNAISKDSPLFNFIFKDNGANKGNWTKGDGTPWEVNGFVVFDGENLAKIPDFLLVEPKLVKKS